MQLINEATIRYGIKPGQLTLHQDCGSPMTANGYLNEMKQLDITCSHSRPRISSDTCAPALRISWADANGSSGMSGWKFRKTLLNIATCLADHFEMTNDRILRHSILLENRFINVIGITLNAIDRLQDMRKIANQPCVHTGIATASTDSRNVSGNAIGVSTYHRYTEKLTQFMANGPNINKRCVR